jgi:endonuclease/exonuclease/phosphatase (EEP) superfamily protein YafD
MRALRVALNLFLWPAALLLALACAGAATAAQWGRVSLRLDLLTHPAPLWLLGASLALVVSMLFRGWRRSVLALSSLAGLVAAGALIVPEYLRSAGPHAPPDAPGQLKIVQFNVWHSNPAPEAILAWLDVERPDIVVVEENSGRFVRAVARHGGWSMACAHCGVMMLSRTPAPHVRQIRPAHGPEAPLADVMFRDQQGPFEVIGVHNAWPTDPDQPFQEHRLAALVADRPQDRLILTGDFNSAPWSFQRQRWDRALRLTRRERAIATWPARNYGRLRWLGLPFLPIDHVYAGPGWATVSVRRGPRLSSDHYPVVLTLAPVAPQ